MEKYKNIIIAAVLIVLAFIGYSFFTGGNQDDILVENDVTAESASGERELIALLSELRSLSLDESVFSDGLFRSLQDFSQELVPEPVGRQNPFAPRN